MIYHHVYKFWLLSLLDEFGNFKEASNQARITQSALSQSISALESQMQASMVVRERGYIKLTEEGRALLEKVRPILRELDGISTSRFNQESLQGQIALGAYESIAIYFLPKMFKRMAAFHPNLRLDVKTSRTDELLKLVGKGELDMALVVNPAPNKKFQIEKVCDDEFGLYITTEHPRLDKGVFLIQELGLATISPTGDGYPMYYKKFVKRIPVEYKNSINCDSFETIRNLALSGVIVGLLPNRVAERTPGELTKLWPTSSEDSRVSSHHISVVSRKSVDRKIHNLVIDEFKAIL